MKDELTADEVRRYGKMFQGYLKRHPGPDGYESAGDFQARMIAVLHDDWANGRISDSAFAHMVDAVFAH